MRVRALAGLLASAALLGAVVAEHAVASPPAPAPALFAPVARLQDELALAGRGEEALGSPGPQRLTEIRFTNRDGFQLTVVGFGQTVALSVGNQHGGKRGTGVIPRSSKRSSVTTYLAHGEVTPDSIEASFADRGRISLRFHSDGRRVLTSKRAGCARSRGGTIADLGTFVGELRFRGEGGYTSAEVHRVHGGSVKLAALASCLSGAASSVGGASASAAAADAPAVPEVGTHPHGGPKRTTLTVERKLPLSRTIFAVQSRRGDPTRFLALSTGSEGSLGVIRFVTASASASAFSFDDVLSAATVAPPAPFSGNGAFRQDATGKSWTGSLAVSFLGAPRVPLTGDDFTPRLARGW